MKIDRAVGSWMLLIALIVGCQRSPESATQTQRDPSRPIRVLTTTGMVADLARNVGGDQVEVVQLLGPGTDPHLYKPTRDDVQSILGADVVFYSGLMLEGKMGDTLVRAGRSKPVWAVTEAIDETYLLEPEDAQGHFDPHVWNDIQAWSQCIEVVRKALADFDPDHADDYQANAAKYQQQLSELHEFGLRSMQTIPAENRILVTSHDAFNYFGRAYDLQVLGVQGLSTESEAGLQRINGLVDLLIDKKVRAVFVESSVPRKNIEALVNGAASRGQEVKIGGELFSDAMGAAGSYEGTYVGMMDHNITRVVRALGGEAPERGLNDKLSE
ncbi:Periplasmic zinc-binding protein TroA precursor [Rosistilla ulvae]|uniref:Periplasmic zinc-binding protein TroA n=1 Tax=Rosistilla ulvae TaxID=1930277 RepID=A0A517LWF6_9BACT|nr:zinc ABC transporter substrate-binding protein [Rosistilla ulvae]QDS86960.1 Periplasmic zinc-binding protein TroA precursor [Rosistilla ulvae]